MQADQSIVDKIKRLQILAQRAGTEAEAALAAEKVEELCLKHNLEIGAIALEQEETKASEAIHQADGLRASPHWWSLTSALKTMFDVGVYTRKHEVPQKQGGFITGTTPVTQIVFYGLKANTESALITYQYLLASVEAMLEGWIRAGNRTDQVSRRAFRIGCARRVGEQIEQHYRKRLEGVALGSETMAIVRVANQLVKAHTKDKGLVRSTSRSSVSNSVAGAYQAGYSAGARVNIHGARSNRMITG